MLRYFTAAGDDPAGSRPVIRAARPEVRDGRLVRSPDTPVAPLAARLTRGPRGGTTD